MRPAYEHRCAARCTDRLGKPRQGTQWIHVRGRTLWVCEPCADTIGKLNGIPSSRPRKARLVLAGQLGLDLAPETHSGHQAEA